MKKYSIICFFVSFLTVITASYVFAVNDNALVYYNTATGTKIAYRYKGQNHILPGNEDIASVENGMISCSVPFRAIIEKYDDKETGKYSEIKMARYGEIENEPIKVYFKNNRWISYPVKDKVVSESGGNVK